MTKRRSVLPGAAILVLALASAASGQELSVSLAAGGLFPSGDSYRAIYGSSVVAGGDVWLKLKGPLGFATGFSQLTDDGIALGPSDIYPVRFRRQTIPLVLFYQLDIGPVDLRAGAGLGFHRFRETWRDIDLDYSGRRTSPRFLVSVSVEAIKRVSLFSSVTYDPIRERLGNMSSSEVALGGIQVSGGLSVRIF